MTVRNDPKVTLLRSVPGFDDVPDRDLLGLGALFDEVRVDAGRVLAREGHRPHELVLILDGEAHAERRGSTGDVLRAGALVGDRAVLDRAPHDATVVTDTPMHALVAGPDSVQSVISHPAVVRAVASSLARRLRAADG